MSNESLNKSALAAAFLISIPVLFGYISIGFAFGFLLVKAGYAWFWAPIMCLLIFAGAAQFLAVGMLSQGKSPLEMGLAVLLLNARHMVYGFSLLERFARHHWAKAYLIFGLTDETYGLLTSVETPDDVDPQKFDFFLTALNQGYWTLGSTLGALFGSFISWEARGIEFSMTALFTVLLVEQIRNIRKASPFVVSLVICGLLYLTGLESILLPAILLASGAMFLLSHWQSKRSPT